MRTLVKASLCKSSRKSYSRHFSRFKHFMGLNFPNVSTKPAFKKHIAAFVSFLFKSNYSPSTITSDLSAISYMHKIAGFKDPTDSFLIRKMLIGAKNLAASLDVRLPITLDILISLTDVLSKAVESIYIQKLLASMFSLSFFAFMRVGEITLKSRKGDSKSVLQYNDISFKQSSTKCGLCVRISHFKHNTWSTFHFPGWQS